MTEEDIKGKVPIMSFYFGPVNVGWIYIEPPHFEIRTFNRQDIDYTALTDYYPDIVIMNLHLKNVRHSFADSYIIRIHSKEVKEAFKTISSEFDPYKAYYHKIVDSLSQSTTSSSYEFSPTELKTLKQLVYSLYLLGMHEYIEYPLLTDEEA